DRMANGMPAVASKQGPTDLTGKADLSGAMSCGPLVRPWDTKMSGLLPRSSVVVTWKAGCGESRTSGLEWGKDREVLPITTWGAVMLPGYPAGWIPLLSRGWPPTSSQALAGRHRGLAPVVGNPALPSWNVLRSRRTPVARVTVRWSRIKVVSRNVASL